MNVSSVCKAAESEIEDLYFDDELCGENVCRERHLRLQSPSRDQLAAIARRPTYTAVGTASSVEEVTVNDAHGESQHMV